MMVRYFGLLSQPAINSLTHSLARARALIAGLLGCPLDLILIPLSFILIDPTTLHPRDRPSPTVAFRMSKR